MIIEGKAISFNSPTVIARRGELELKEQILPSALDGADMKDCCLRYNHMDSVLILARTRGGSLALETRDDGVYFRAELFNTTTARDCYELVKHGALQCSFAFTAMGKKFDPATRLRSITKIGRLLDLSLVDIPAYGDTFVTARGSAELDRDAEELDSLIADKKRLIIRTYLM